jgi:hypothetical protein
MARIRYEGRARVILVIVTASPVTAGMPGVT